MAQAIGPPDPPVIRTHYRHLLSEDAIVWTRWLQKNAHRIGGVWYDVHVGRTIQVPPGLPESIALDAAAISRKRIDVVARAPAELWVIELKPYGNYTALGQALVYSRLFGLEYPGSLPIVPMVICCEVDTDLIDDYARFGVRWEEVGYPPFARP